MTDKVVYKRKSVYAQNFQQKTNKSFALTMLQEHWANLKTKDEIGEKIELLNDKIAGLRAEKDELSNELKVILAGSELQSIMLTSTLVNSEAQNRDLLEKFERRAEELNKKYEEASVEENIEMKNQVHAMIWTNDIRLDTIKWVLEEDDDTI